MLIVVSGPAASGKDTIVQKLLQKYQNFNRVITTTTRPKRFNEINNRDYFFVNKEAFEQMTKEGKFIEWVDFSGNFYGTTKEAINPAFKGENLIWRVETSRAAKISEILPPDFQNQTLVIYIDVPDWKMLESRMRRRGIGGEEITRRLQKDKEDFQKYGSNFQHIVYNKEGELENTINEISKLINNMPPHQL